MSPISIKLQKFKDKILDSIASLSPRDRMIYAVMAFLIVFGGLSASIITMNKALAKQSDDLEEAKLNLRNISQLFEEQGSLRKSAEEIELRIREHEGTDLSAFLEKSAQKEKIAEKITSVNKKQLTVIEGNLQEQAHSVTMRNLSVEEFSKFLYQIETSGYPLQIKNCNIKTRKRKDGNTLEVNLDISAYSYSEESK